MNSGTPFEKQQTCYNQIPELPEELWYNIVKLAVDAEEIWERNNNKRALRIYTDRHEQMLFGISADTTSDKALKNLKEYISVISQLCLVNRVFFRNLRNIGVLAAYEVSRILFSDKCVKADQEERKLLQSAVADNFDQPNLVRNFGLQMGTILGIDRSMQRMYSALCSSFLNLFYKKKWQQCRGVVEAMRLQCHVITQVYPEKRWLEQAQ